MVDTSNGAFLKGLWNMSQAILSAVPKGIRKDIPTVRMSSGLWGVKSYCGSVIPQFTLWNKDLQRDEVRVLQPKAVVKRTVRSESHANLLQFFTEDPSGSIITDWASGYFGVAEAGYSRSRVAVSDLL
jgi:hypothetical protein